MIDKAMIDKAMIDKENSWRRWLRALSVCTTLAVSFHPARAGVMIPIPGDPLTIDTGKVSGTLLPSGVHAYFGIPFAAPPIGELRWHAPVPAKPWKGIYNADSARQACVQALYPSRRADTGPLAMPMGEDCLYLNVWTPPGVRPGAKLPVLVWIYGGSFAWGSPSIEGYSGAEIVKKGVVYVAISYRLNVFGFLAHPELTKESGHGASGNWGMLDQIAALQWVQRNIAAFGGEPTNVTLLGQSAGSISLHMLQSSPLARGLFAKLCGWSGSYFPPGGQNPQPLKEAEADGLKAQEALHVSSLAEMRTVAWDRVLAAVQQAGVRVHPVVDGYFLPDVPVNIFKAGKQNDVPIYVSSTAKDGGGSMDFFMVKKLAELQKLAKETFGEYTDEFFRLFPASNDAEAVKQAQAVVGGVGMGISNRDWARAQTVSGKQPAYLAQISRVQPFAQDAKWINFDPRTAGAMHAGDIAYWLGTLDPQEGSIKTSGEMAWEWDRNWTAWDRELSDKMQSTVVAFAKTGNPGTDAVKIPRYDPNNEQRVVFGDTIYIEKLNTAALEFLRAHPTQRAGRR